RAGTGPRGRSRPDVENVPAAPSPVWTRPQWTAADKETDMPKYLILKHYRGTPPTVNDHPMDEWTPAEVDAHMRFMDEFGARLQENGELVDAQALAMDGAWVRAEGPGKPPVTDGPFAETKDLIAGWYVVDVDGWDRA